MSLSRTFRLPALLPLCVQFPSSEVLEEAISNVLARLPILRCFEGTSLCCFVPHDPEGTIQALSQRGAVVQVKSDVQTCCYEALLELMKSLLCCDDSDSCSKYFLLGNGETPVFFERASISSNVLLGVGLSFVQCSSVDVLAIELTPVVCRYVPVGTHFTHHFHRQYQEKNLITFSTAAGCEAFEDAARLEMGVFRPLNDQQCQCDVILLPFLRHVVLQAVSKVVPSVNWERKVFSRTRYRTEEDENAAAAVQLERIKKMLPKPYHFIVPPQESVDCWCVVTLSHPRNSDLECKEQTLDELMGSCIVPINMLWQMETTTMGMKKMKPTLRPLMNELCSRFFETVERLALHSDTPHSCVPLFTPESYKEICNQLPRSATPTVFFESAADLPINQKNTTFEVQGMSVASDEKAKVSEFSKDFLTLSQMKNSHSDVTFCSSQCLVGDAIKSPRAKRKRPCRKIASSPK